MAKVTAVIPTIKGREEMLDKLLTTLPEDCERIIVPFENMPLSAKRTWGAALANGEFILFVDDDNYLENYAVNLMVECFKNPDIGVVGAMACYHDRNNIVADGGSRRFYTSGFMMGVNTNAEWNKLSPHLYDVDEVANCFMVRADFFFSIGGLDYKTFPMDLDEADICKRVKDAGKRVVICPVAVCYHKSITYSYLPDFRRPKNAYFMGRNRVLYQKKHLSKKQFFVYITVFFPVFVAFYIFALAYRRKFSLMPHFLKGVLHGLQGRLANQYL